ncbi:MAG: hypothetical protein QOI42_1820, partial [Frankiaceae bacterium]|nr:hypothetical protein [Frankiaceae bacterium]
TGAPLAANSAALVANLAQQVAEQYGGNAAFNVYHYNVSFYTASASTTRADVRWDDCQHKGYLPAGIVEQFASVPIPDDALPSPGTDGELTVYSPTLDTIWEFWQAKHQVDGWHACWGGRLDNVSTTSLPYFPNGFGSSATGLLDAAGAISIADVQAGHIDHAIAIAISRPAVYTAISWPAQRSDGWDTASNAIPEGTRFRLDPSIDVDSLGLSAIAAMVAKAAQTYGMIVTDKAGCVSVVAETGAGIAARTGTNPWDALLAGTHDYEVLARFPWDRMQAMPRDYLKP